MMKPTQLTTGAVALLAGFLAVLLGVYLYTTSAHQSASESDEAFVVELPIVGSGAPAMGAGLSLAADSAENGVVWSVDEIITAQDGSIVRVAVVIGENGSTHTMLAGLDRDEASYESVVFTAVGDPEDALVALDESADQMDDSSDVAELDQPIEEEQEEDPNLIWLRGVVVLESTSRTVPGAHVRISYQRLDADVGEMIILTTSPDGAFLARLPRGSSGAVMATHEGKTATQGFTLRSAEPEHWVTLVFRDVSEEPDPTKFGTITGVLQTANGKVPITGAPVRTGANSPPSLGKGTVTGIDGSFTLSGMTPGVYEVEAIHPFDSSLTASGTVTVATGATASLTLEIPGDADLLGIVVDEMGTPIADAAVIAVNPVSPRGAEILTDEEGFFKIYGLFPTTVLSRLTVTHPDFMPETRSLIQLQDGVQRIVLRPRIGVTLRVVWPDGTPVERYVYRLLRPGLNRMMILDRPPVPVYQEGGAPTIISDIGAGEWRVEVTPIADNETVSDLRSGRNFTVTLSEEHQEVVVTLDGGRSISGVVRLNDSNGPVVTNARVQLAPPVITNGDHQADRSSPVSAPVYTDSEGRFRIRGVTPGFHRLTVHRDELVTEGPVAIEVGSDVDPEPLTVIVRRGAILRGMIYDTQGNPATSGSVSVTTQSAGGTEYQGAGRVTTTNGEYRLEGLWPGHYFVFVSTGQNHDTREIPLGPGEEKELDFDFSNRVRVHGRITYNGQPASPGNPSVSLSSETTRNLIVTIKDNTGEYEVRVPPGIYNAFVFHQVQTIGRFLGVDELIVVPEGSREVRRDLDIRIMSAEVVVGFPDDVPFQPGEVKISERTSAARYNFLRESVTQPNRFIAGISRGEYMATYTSSDRRWGGDSGWVVIASGAPNRFVIEAKPTDMGAVVFRWSPGDLGTSIGPVSADVTHLIASRGTLDVFVRYSNGRHAVVIESAELFMNGQSIARDRHDGWSGFDHVNIRYHLPVSQYRPDAQFILQVMMRTDGGTDSEGTIYAHFQ